MEKETPDPSPETPSDVESKSESMDVDQSAAEPLRGSEQESTAQPSAAEGGSEQISTAANESKVTDSILERSKQAPMVEANSGHLNQQTDLKEYEVQYFGFTPQSFANGVYNAMVDYLQDVVEVTQEYILKEFEGKDDVSKEVVKQGSDRLFAVFIDTFNSSFDRLESYLLKNIFHIPSNVVLPEDKVNQEHQYTEAEESQLDAELEGLRQNIKDAMYVNARLRQYMQDIEIAQAQLDAFLTQLDTWHAICKQNNVANLAESITFVANKMTGLQEQLTNVLHQAENNVNQGVKPETQIEVDSTKF